MADFFKGVFDELQAQVDKGAKLLLKDEADRLIAQAKKLTPVDTGTLRGTYFRTEVKVSGSDYSIEVVNPLKYAVPVEGGHRLGKTTRFYPGVFMLERAMEIVLKNFRGKFAKIVPPLRG